MKPHILFITAPVLNGFVQALPQILSIVIGSPGNLLSLPNGVTIPTDLPTTTPANSFSFPSGISIPTDLPTTISKTTKTSTTSSSSSSTSHTTSKSSFSTSSTTTNSPATPTNPYNAPCSIPSSYTVNGFKSTSGSSGSISLTITYNGGTFTCPSDEDEENGVFYIDCDPDGLVQLTTDGSSYLYVQEWFWCTAVPQAHDSFSTLQSSANATNLASVLSCTTDSNHNQEYLQIQSNFVIPVQEYGVGGIIGFDPVDFNGAPAPNCPTVVDVDPIVTTSCSPPPTSVTKTGPSTISTSILNPTVTINGR